MMLESPTIPEPPASVNYPELLSRGMRNATKKQRRVVNVVVACGGCYATAARRLAVSRQAVQQAIYGFRRRMAAST